MMQISSNVEYAQNSSFDINLAAAIQLKNMVRNHWKYTENVMTPKLCEDDSDEECKNKILLSAEDKEFVKTHIINSLSHAPSLGVLSQFEEIVHVVAKYEMPENWPNVMDEISTLLHESEEAKVFGGLIALKEVVHRFEFEFKDRRIPLQEIVDQLFPRIEQMLVDMLNLTTADALRAKNIILDTFYLACN